VCSAKKKPPAYAKTRNASCLAAIWKMESTVAFSQKKTVLQDLSARIVIQLAM
jgi:hypothetical protein